MAYLPPTSFALLGSQPQMTALLGGGRMPAMTPPGGSRFRSWVGNNPEAVTTIAAGLMSGRTPGWSHLGLLGQGL